MVPQQPPASSTTGRLVVRCSSSFRRASSRGSSALQQADGGRMIVSTGTSDARRSSAATRWHTSASVTTPTKRRLVLSSTTGAQPHPVLCIACAACCVVSRGVQHESISTGSILSLQQLIVLGLSSYLFMIGINRQISSRLVKSNEMELPRSGRTRESRRRFQKPLQHQYLRGQSWPERLAPEGAKWSGWASLPAAGA